MNQTGYPSNPQGKGLTPTLDHLHHATKHLAVSAKDVQQLSDELFTSLFVLSSRFGFKPVFGRNYWLYRKNEQYRLSLIAPEQWPQSRSGRYIGACRLQTDLTWTLELSELCRNDKALIEEITRKRDRFEQSIRQAVQIDDILPTYIPTLPFYSRVLASALSISLRRSMLKSEIHGLTFSQAKKLIERHKK